MSTKDMDMVAELLVNDYNPALLKEPQPINYEHFIEYYLGADLQYQDITNDESILGITSFDEGITKVYDLEDDCEKYIKIKEGTIIIDNHLLTAEKEGRLRFTALHEGGGHWWCHKDLYSKNKGQMYFDFIDNSHAVIRCRANSIENFSGKRKLINQDDWMEYQADYMASAIAMPKKIFFAIAEQVLKDAGIPDRWIVTGVDADYDVFAADGFPSIVAEAFKVSKQAAEIKLKHFGFIKDISIIHDETRQCKIW